MMTTQMVYEKCLYKNVDEEKKNSHICCPQFEQHDVRNIMKLVKRTSPTVPPLFIEGQRSTAQFFLFHTYTKATCSLVAPHYQLLLSSMNSVPLSDQP